MYIPMMKNREQEMKVLTDMNKYFSDSIIPYVEIINDKYKIRYKKDPENGKYIYELKPGNKNRSRIKLPETEEDIITLQQISESLKSKKAFIDFFRFDEGEYKKNNLDYQRIALAVKLRDFQSYRKRLLEIGDFDNLIPVISIKNGFDLSEYQLQNLLHDLKMKNEIICIRLTDDYLDNYSKTFKTYLKETDYLMLDIREQNFHSKFIEIDEFQELETKAIKIILSSPRPRDLTNKEYDDMVFTDKISNDVVKFYKEKQLEIDGFGDFGGLKDDLPRTGGGGGLGAALALIYSKEKNAFFSVVNKDTSLGPRGYKYVKACILRNSRVLNRLNNCLAFEYINNMSGNGSWKNWNYITLTRYIHQHAIK